LNPRHADYDLARRSPRDATNTHTEQHQVFDLIGYLHRIPPHPATCRHIQPHPSMLPIRYPEGVLSNVGNTKAATKDLAISNASGEIYAVCCGYQLNPPRIPVIRCKREVRLGQRRKPTFKQPRIGGSCCGAEGRSEPKADGFPVLGCCERLLRD
jgi:hypothetical protein